MGTLERIHQIDQIIATEKHVTSAVLMERLGVSLATLKRDITYLKNHLHAPITFDRKLMGYRYVGAEKPRAKHYKLPHLWFSAEEISALLTMQHLLTSLHRGGLLGPHIKPLLARLSGLLELGGGTAEEIKKRIHLEMVDAPQFHLDHFQIIASALVRRKRLIIRYATLKGDKTTNREVSPHRLIQKQNRFYLCASCHVRHDLRVFPMHTIEAAELLDIPAQEFDDQLLNDFIQSTHSIVFEDSEIANLASRSGRSTQGKRG